MVRNWMSSRPPATGLLTLAAATMLLSGCSSDSQTAYCAEKATNKVVANDRCNGDGGHGAYFFGTGNAGYRQGQVLPAGPRANVNDSAAREQLGIAKTGAIGTKGGFGSTAKAGGSRGFGGFGGHGSAGG